MQYKPVMQMQAHAAVKQALVAEEWEIERQGQAAVAGMVAVADLPGRFPQAWQLS